jgi:hypothetical protein
LALSLLADDDIRLPFVFTAAAAGGRMVRAAGTGGAAITLLDEMVFELDVVLLVVVGDF